jgi:multisubunit Na+/H+ antiporter MnhB subunit
MQIKINQNNASEFIIETNIIRWRLYARRIIFAILLLFICGLILFISGLSLGYDSSISDYHYNHDHNVTYVHTIQNNYHIFSSLGIAFMLFSLYLVYFYLVRQKNQFFNTVNKVAYRHKSISNNYILKITDVSLLYQDFEIIREEKWTLFSKYQNYQNYLLLFRDELFINCLVIDKRQISSEELADLQKFVSNKLVKK